MLQTGFIFLKHSNQNTFHHREHRLRHTNTILWTCCELSAFLREAKGQRQTCLGQFGYIALVLSSSLQRNASLFILPYRPLALKLP
jgi:hypothetical protein